VAYLVQKCPGVTQAPVCRHVHVQQKSLCGIGTPGAAPAPVFHTSPGAAQAPVVWCGQVHLQHRQERSGTKVLDSEHEEQRQKTKTKEGRKTKIRRQSKVFVPQPSKERRKTNAFVPQRS